MAPAIGTQPGVEIGNPPLSKASTFESALSSPTPAPDTSTRLPGPGFSTLQKLQSDDQKTVLDVVDRLRSCGVSEELQMPELIVCGGQSTGKSSVLEAISRVPFPRDNALCTRFATELVLRRDPFQLLKVSITPGPGRSIEKKKDLEEFAHEISDFEDLPAVLEKAKLAMGLRTNSDPFNQLKGRDFSRDILKIECFGPDQPQLTLVDLPGIFRTKLDTQIEGDMELVHELVTSYMKRPRTVILAIVAVGTDFQNQEILGMAKQFDPEGKRTLGIITKPDKLHPGEDERRWLKLARNENFSFELGWHVVRNIDADVSGETLKPTARDQLEAEFFRSSAFKTDESISVGVGIVDLRKRLGDILFEKIQDSLPLLFHEIQRIIPRSKEDLAKLGEERSSLQEQRRFLINISGKIERLCVDAIEGHYKHKFFDDVQKSRLCNILMASDEKFAEAMVNVDSIFGPRPRFTQQLSANVPDGNAEGSFVNRIFLRQIFEVDVDLALEMMAQSRVPHLPGTTNPNVEQKLFVKYSSSWQSIGEEHLTRAHSHIASLLKGAVAYITDSETARKLEKHWIRPKLHEIRILAGERLSTLIRSNNGPLMTNQLTFSQKVECYQHLINSRIELGHLDGSLPDRLAAHQALIRTHAYYDIACDRFVDNVTALAIWDPMVSRVPCVFCPDVVADMKDDLVETIASESHQTISRRAELTKRIRILEDGAEQLKEFVSSDPDWSKTPSRSSPPSKPFSLFEQSSLGLRASTPKPTASKSNSHVSTPAINFPLFSTQYPSQRPFSSSSDLEGAIQRPSVFDLPLGAPQNQSLFRDLPKAVASPLGKPVIVKLPSDEPPKSGGMLGSAPSPGGAQNVPGPSPEGSLGGSGSSASGPFGFSAPRNPFFGATAQEGSGSTSGIFGSTAPVLSNAAPTFGSGRPTRTIADFEGFGGSGPPAKGGVSPQ